MALDKLTAKDSLGFLAWKVARLKTNDLAASFAEAGIEVTVEQWRALIPIYKHDGMTQGKLCEVLSQEKTGVSRLVAALERRGYVVRESSKEDRRVKFISITEAGRKLMDSTVDIALANKSRREDALDPEELAICKKVLWQIIKPSLEKTCGPLKDEC